MNCLRCGMGALLALAVSSARAESVLPDDLYRAYVQAGRDIAAGKDRKEALAPLAQAVEKHPQSRFLPISQRLTSDLSLSIDRAGKRAEAGRSLDDAPAEYLSESVLPLYLLTYPANWKQALPRFLEATPRDPAVLLLAQDRNCIDSLLPQLANHSPTRAFDPSGSDDVPKIPRVSDLALNLIERVSRCKFHFNASSGVLFHELRVEQQEKLAGQIAAWWRENKGKTIAEGIRAQLPNGDFYAQVTMAQNLARLAGDASPADREFGLETLRRLAHSSADYLGAHAARALEEFGDNSSVSRYYQELKRSLDVKGRYYSNSIDALFYLAEHGQRKEWELLREIALKDLQNERESISGAQAYVLGSLLNSKRAASSPYAIPLLGLGLSRTKATGSRYINEQLGSQSFSTADLAAENLQKLTGQDFAYRQEGTDREREAAIQRAQKWWSDEGQAKFTYDYIEKNMAENGAPNKAAR